MINLFNENHAGAGTRKLVAHRSFMLNVDDRYGRVQFCGGWQLRKIRNDPKLLSGRSVL